MLNDSNVKLIAKDISISDLNCVQCDVDDIRIAVNWIEGQNLLGRISRVQLNDVQTNSLRRMRRRLKKRSQGSLWAHLCKLEGLQYLGINQGSEYEAWTTLLR